MIFKNSKICLVVVIFFMLLLTVSCKRKKVIITRDYVINPNWDEHDNSFHVVRMNLKDSSKTINLKDPSEQELYYGLVEDTNFSFSANVRYNGEKYSERKVYFNRDNGFSWWGDRYGKSKRGILGELQPETWYMLAGLSNIKTLYYVYIDSVDSFNVFTVSTMTNF
jgi:hypothetical protein